MMIIPHGMLPTDTLHNLIEDFVTRDGTDNGDDTPLKSKIRQVERALATKMAFIVFDDDSQTCRLMLKQDIPSQWLETPF